MTNILQCTSLEQILNIFPILSEDEVTLVIFFMSLEKSQTLVHSLAIKGVWDSVRKLDMYSDSNTELMIGLISKLQTIRGTDQSEPASMFDEIAMRLVDVATEEDVESLEKILDEDGKRQLHGVIDKQVAVYKNAEADVSEDIEIKDDAS